MLSKTSRQLAIFHIFLCSTVIEVADIKHFIKTSPKTILRDIKELKNAGLIDVKFSRKEKGYIHKDNGNHCPFSVPVFSDNKAKNMHLEKLIRLATIMIGLRYHTEKPYYEDDSENQETCSSWYKNKFPNVSSRTRQRDFEELKKIEYCVEYDLYDKYYLVSFPMGLDDFRI
ncbi:hypothetical protein Amet_3121 [Alkaliphilus metalliredigens QYMF]|uniref:Uncharacterized protein n=1 Tax=Alkaliphilus metalliredigens (strain QYMF) TaxID=293826 RepID=A6TSU2_ALKMQ|nr:hypothetical protein [Alkaliphilus metalliredigens]ABR49260.1 hypothetical protein Amet_3121 [Alkaliphilus metalliredigens QYMF]